MTVDELQANLNKTLGGFNDNSVAAMTLAQKVENDMKTLSNNITERLTGHTLGTGTTSTVASTAADDLKVFGKACKRDVDASAYAAYQAAFDQYLRRGENGMSTEMRNALSVGYEQGGGYLVTPDRTGPMIEALRQTSPVRQVASQQTISTDALEGPIDNDEVDSGWVSEQQARPETKTPDLGKYRIDLQEQYAKPKVTQQLLDDASVDVAAWLNGKIADRFGRVENAAFVRGNGSGKPRGFLDYPKALTTDKTRPWGTVQIVLSGAAGGFINPTTGASPADCLVDLVFALKSAYRAGAAFAMNSTTAGIVRKWKDAQGRFIWQDSLQAGMPNLLMGFPVVFFEDMDDVAAGAFPIAFANWKRAYTIVDHRVGTRVLVDPYTSKPYVLFYSTKRAGGGVTGSDSLKLLKIAAA